MLKLLQIVIKMLFPLKIQLLVGIIFLSICAIAQADTVGFWEFESGVADSVAIGNYSIIDSSGYNNNGTPVGYPVYRGDTPGDVIPQTNSPNKMSLEFDGSNEIVFDSKFIFHKPGDATVEFWIKAPLSSDSSALWSIGNDDDINRFNLWLRADGALTID